MLQPILKRKSASVGGWCALSSSLAAETVGRCGFDWVCVDVQHGMIDDGELVPMLQALAATQTPSIVRVGWNEPRQIMRALDAGAQGVMVPMVNDRADAMAAVAACRYPPAGFRSWGPTRASLGVDGFTPESANASVACIVMVETWQAMDNLQEIASTSGVDGIFIGSNDLALSRSRSLGGAASQAQKDQHEADLAAILAASTKAGKPVGISCPTVEVARQRAAQGYRLLALPSDMTLIQTGASEMVGRFRAGDERG